MVFRMHVMGEGVGDGGDIEHAGLVGLPEIEEVAALAALVEGTEFSAEEFGGGVNGQGGLTCKPARFHGEAGLLDGKQTEMFAGVDFDFQAQPNDRWQFGFETIDECGSARTDVALWLAEPWVHTLTEEIEGATNGFFAKLDEVEIFGISGGGFENDFVEGRAATK